MHECLPTECLQQSSTLGNTCGSVGAESVMNSSEAWDTLAQMEIDCPEESQESFEQFLDIEFWVGGYV